MSQRLLNVFLWTVVFVSIGIVLAAGARVVSWIMLDEATGPIWKSAMVLVIAATSGGSAAAAIKNGVVV